MCPGDWMDIAGVDAVRGSELTPVSHGVPYKAARLWLGGFAGCDLIPVDEKAVGVGALLLDLFIDPEITLRSRLLRGANAGGSSHQ